MYSNSFVTIILFISELISYAFAEDNSIVIGSNVSSVLGLIILILDIFAIFELLSSSSHGICSKMIWILIILFFPIGGIILYSCCARNRTVNQDL